MEGDHADLALCRFSETIQLQLYIGKSFWQLQAEAYFSSQYTWMRHPCWRYIGQRDYEYEEGVLVPGGARVSSVLSSYRQPGRREYSTVV